MTSFWLGSLSALLVIGSCSTAAAEEKERPRNLPRYQFPVNAVKPAEERPVELEPMKVVPQDIPVPIVHYNPPMPMQARNRWEEGCVVLEYSIRPDGTTDDFVVVEANPPGVFEKSVILAVSKWRFEPRGVELRLTEHFRFTSPIHRMSPTYTVMSARSTTASGNGRIVSRNSITMKRYQAPECSGGSRR